MSELIAMCVQKEERLKIEKPDTTYLTTTKGHEKKFFKGNKGFKWEKGNSDKASSSNGKESSPKCRFCKNPGHFQKVCPKFQEWLDKKEKSESLDVFKIFKSKVENQLNRKIKIVRSDRGGEYYGKHSDLGQSPGPFALYCQENGIVNHSTMPYTLQQNGVAERQNDLKGIGSIALIIPLGLSKQGMLNFLKMVKSMGVVKEALT
ncbi:retrovirus-related pol polyprotein from transposon TNT 1-94 [Tanacetum coccineum]